MKRSIKLPITFQQLEGDGFHIFTEIRVFNDTFFALIDTGASKTVFSDKVIKMYPSLEMMDVNDNLAAGIGEDKISAKMALFPELYLGKAKLSNFYCGIIDFSHVHAAYETMGLIPFDVIIGGDILHALQAEISYKQAFLKIQPL